VADDVQFIEKPLSSATLLGAIAGTPLLWVIQLAFTHFFTPIFCQMGRKWMLHVITGVCLLLAGLPLFICARAWSRLAKQKPSPTDIASTEEISGRQLLAVVGVMASTFFLMLILATGIPPIIVDPCAE
jgi:hypothetical protein